MQENFFKIYTVKYIGRACFISMNHLLRMFSKGLYLDGKYPIKQNHTSSKSSTKVQCNKLISVLGHKLYGFCAILQLCFGKCTSTCEVTSKFEFYAVCTLPPPPPPPRLTSLKPLLGICQQLNKWKKVDASQDIWNYNICLFMVLASKVGWWVFLIQCCHFSVFF